MTFTQTFCGKKYRVSAEKLDGWADQQNDNERHILLLRDIGSKAGLETAIHEALHACDWKATESRVTKVAHDIARMLWRLGYRKQD